MSDISYGTWKGDPVRSEIAFSVRQLAVGKVRGRFTGHDITIVTSEDPLGSSVAATIDLASIDTGNGRRDDHLRSAAYFDVGTYPAMSYRSTGVRRAGDGWVVDGDLSLHGVTRQVPLTVEMNGAGTERAFTATARVRRRDFGITSPLDFVVADRVSISLAIKAVREG